MQNLEWLLAWFKQNESIVKFQPMTHLSNNQLVEVRDRLSKLYFSIKNEFPEYAERLFVLKNSLDIAGGMVNVATFSRISEALVMIDILIKNAKISKWTYIHKKFQYTVRGLFLQGFYKSSLDEASQMLMARLKEINNFISNSEIDIDGIHLVERLFPEKDPKILFNNMQTRTEKNVQKGYTNLFKGWVYGIRNRNSHPGNYTITEASAFQELILLSMLMAGLDERIDPPFLELEKE